MVRFVLGQAGMGMLNENVSSRITVVGWQSSNDMLLKVRIMHDAVIKLYVYRTNTKKATLLGHNPFSEFGWV